MGGVLAIDLGERKTGFAVTDALRIVRQPLDAVRVPGDSNELLAHVARLLSERQIETLLVGLPVPPGGLEPDEAPAEGTRAAATLDFVRRLRERFPGVDVQTLDETLTTKEAEARLRDAGYRGRAVKERKDSFSALVLLEEWLGEA